jgi:MFS family permease
MAVGPAGPALGADRRHAWSGGFGHAAVAVWHRNRNWAALAGIFLFGAFALPLYSLSAAHANDHAKPGQYVILAAGLSFFFSIGAIAGPVVAAQVLQVFGTDFFFMYTSIIHIVFVAVTLWRMSARAHRTWPQRSAMRRCCAPRRSCTSWRTSDLRHARAKGRIKLNRHFWLKAAVKCLHSAEISCLCRRSHADHQNNRRA